MLKPGHGELGGQSGAGQLKAEAETEKCAKIENARDRSLWRFNFDHSAVQPVLCPSVNPAVDSSLSWRSTSGCAGTEPPTCVSAPHSSTTDGQTSGSDRFRIFGSTGAHIRSASAAPRIRPPSGNPFDARRTISPPARPTTYLRLASGAVLQLGWRPHSACAACSPTTPAGF